MGARPGRPTRALTPYQRRLLAVLGAATLIDGYDQGILTLALPQVQADLGIPEDEVGRLIGTIRLGVLPAILLTLLADVVGRRRLLLATIVGLTAATTLTAFARGTSDFLALQLLARVFITAEAMLAIVVIVEELPPAARGRGLGVLGMMSALGHGAAALVFAAVTRLPYGWRALYFAAVVPLALLAWFRRSLRETARFAAHRERLGAVRARDVWRPLQHLLRMYPGRLAALGGAVFPAWFVAGVALPLASKHLQDVHGYAPAEVAATFLGLGVAAPAGSLLAGRWGDRFGRKTVLVVALALNAAAIALFLNGTGAWVPLAWGLAVLTIAVVDVLFGALGTELFPTSYRSTASGFRTVLGTLGAASGLWLEGRLYAAAGSHAAAITWMLWTAPIAPVVVALLLPETANRTLEELAPERD